MGKADASLRDVMPIAFKEFRIFGSRRREGPTVEEVPPYHKSPAPLALQVAAQAVGRKDFGCESLS